MKNRSPLAVVALSIVTLGIYDLYWLVKTKAVLNKSTNYHTPTVWLLFSPFILLLVGYIGMFAAGGVQTTSNSYGQNQVSSISHPAAFFIFVALMVIGWISTLFISAFWFFRFSKAVNQYTNGKMSTAVTFLVLWVIHLIGVALVQDAFNDMESAAVEAGGPMPGPGPAPQAGTPQPVQPPQQPPVA